MNVINKRTRASRSAAINAVSTWTLRSQTFIAICWSSELLLFVGAYNNFLQTSPDGITWTTRTIPSIGYINSIIWSSELSLFVVTSYTGASNVITSPDGITWTSYTTPAFTGNNGWVSVCFSCELNLFVGVSYSEILNTNWVMTSPNGTTWTAQTTPSGNYWSSICWSSELLLFVTVNGNTSTISAVASSPDGITWTIRTTPSVTNMSGVTWSPELSLFAAVGSNIVITSPDGINWTSRSVPTGEWNTIVWCSELSIFVVCNSVVSATTIMSSHDGINWTARTTPNTQCYGMCYSPELSMFISVGINNILTSNMGIPASNNTVLAPKSQLTINSSGNVGINTSSPAYKLDVNGNAHFGSSGTTSTVLTSNRINSLGYMINANTVGNSVTTNMNVINKRTRASRSAAVNAVSTWTLRTSSASQGICWSSELSLFVSAIYTTSATTNAIQTSPDGITWTTRTTPSIGFLSYIIWSSELSLFVATSYQTGTSSVITSSNGTSWTLQTTPAFTGTNGWNAICYSPELNLFVCTLVSSTSNTSWIMTSTNGTTWTAQTTPSGNTWYSVCWSSELNLFIAVNSNTSTTSAVASSPDGITWTIRTTPSVTNIAGVTWSPELGLFAANGTNIVITSPDGINWTSRSAPTGTWNTIVWSSELSIFVACNTTVSTTAIMTSHDGINWTAKTTPSTQCWGICYSPELSMFIAVNPLSTNIITSNMGIPASSNTILAPKSQLTINSSGNVGINNSNPSSQLDVISTNTFGNIFLGTNVQNRKIVLYSSSVNDHQYYGFGINTGTLRYQVDITTADHVFYAANSSTASNELLRIKGTGNVGIGTSSPLAQLSLNNDFFISANSASWNTTAGKGIFMRYSTNGQDSAYIQSVDRSSSIFYPMSLEAQSLTLTTNSVPRLYVGSTGNVGINTTSPSGILQISSAALFTSSGNLTCTGDIISFGSVSDQRLKINITSLSSELAIDAVKKLNPVTFNWRNDIFNIEKQNQFDSGFIAQEIEAILPHATGEYTHIESGTVYKNIKHERIVPYLTTVIQNLLERIEILEKKQI
jgi:hypothetical protein